MPSPRAIVRDRVRSALKELKRGRPAAARALLEPAVGLDPNNGEAAAYLGIALLGLGDAKAAVAHLEAAQPKLADQSWLIAHLADAYARSGRAEEACEAYRRACAMDPGNTAYQLGHAIALALNGQPDDAAQRLESLLRSEPRNAVLWFNLGNARRDQMRLDDAVRCFTAALDIEPGWVDARNSLGSVLHALLRYNDAEQAYRACAAAQPDQIAFRLNLASLLIDAGHPTDAERECADAVARWPKSAMAHSFLGQALAQQGKLRQALEHERAATELDPNDVHYAENYAHARLVLASEDGDTSEFARVLATAPGSDRDHLARALALLGNGQLGLGWTEYAYRTSAAKFELRFPSSTRRLTLPDHEALVRGAMVHLVGEQGLGDELFLLRFARLLHQVGARLRFLPDPKILELLRRHGEPIAEFIDGESVDPSAELMMIGDLPHALRDGAIAAQLRELSREFDYPAPLALKVTGEATASLQEQLRRCGPPPYLAVTWHGGTPPAQQRATWAQHKALEPALVGKVLRDVPCTVICVQRNPVPEHLRAFTAALGRPAHDFSGLNDDLVAMAALLSTVDEYVCVSNTNTHIRAGTGRSARVLVPCPPEWRWPAGRSTSPWFPSFSVYHQRPDGDWAKALQALGLDLARHWQ